MKIFGRVLKEKDDTTFFIAVNMYIIPHDQAQIYFISFIYILGVDSTVQGDFSTILF